MAYTQSTDVTNRISTDLYTRLFDRNADANGTEISAYLAQCITDAESEINMRCYAYFQTLFNANGATVDPAIISYIVDVVCWHACKRNPSAQAERDAPFLRAYKLAMDFFDRMGKDDRARTLTSAGGRAQPRAIIDNAVQADGVTNSGAYNRVADGKDGSGY